MDSRIPGQVDAALQGDPQLAFNTSRSTGIEALEALGTRNVSDKRNPVPENSNPNEKQFTDEIRYVPTEETLEIGKGMTAAQKVDNMEEIALFALHVDDDTSLNPWTVCISLRML